MDQYVVTMFGVSFDYQRAYDSRSAAERAALRLKRRHGAAMNVSVDFVPSGGPFCPCHELSDDALAERVAGE